MLNLNPISTRNPKLSPIQPHERRQNLGTFMTIRKNDIYMSVSLYDQMGRPDYVEFAFDPDQKILAIRATDESNPYGIQIKRYGKNSSELRIQNSVKIRDIVIDMLGMKDDNGIEEHNVQLCHPTTFNGYICFNMKFSDLIPIKKQRRRKNE